MNGLLVDKAIERILEVNSSLNISIIEYLCEKESDSKCIPIEWSKDHIIVNGDRYLHNIGGGDGRGMLLDGKTIYDIRRLKGNIIVNDVMEYTLFKLLHKEHERIVNTLPRRIIIKDKKEDLSSYIINMSTGKKLNNYFNRILRNLVIWNIDNIGMVESYREGGCIRELYLVSRRSAPSREDMINSYSFTDESVEVKIVNNTIVVSSPDIIYRIICRERGSVNIPKVVQERLGKRRRVLTAFKYSK